MGSAWSHLLAIFVYGANAGNPLAKDLSIKFSSKRFKMVDSSEGFKECLENVLRLLEGKGFKIRLKSEQKKAIRQLYEGKDLLAVHFEM